MIDKSAMRIPMPYILRGSKPIDDKARFEPKVNGMAKIIKTIKAKRVFNC